MAKRLRQTSLFETAKKRCEESSSVSVDRDQESPSTDSQLDPQSDKMRQSPMLRFRKMEEIAKDFIAVNSERINYFGTF